MLAREGAGGLVQNEVLRSQVRVLMCMFERAGLCLPPLPTSQRMQRREMSTFVLHFSTARLCTILDKV
jgi:hypothetical protein